MANNTHKSNNVLLVGIVALLGVIAILMGVIAFKDTAQLTVTNEETSSTQHVPKTPSEQVTAPSVQDPATNDLTMPQQLKQVDTLQEAVEEDPIKALAKQMIIANTDGQKDSFHALLRDFPLEQSSALFLAIDKEKIGMGAGFLIWLHQNGKQPMAETTYDGLPVKEKARLIEVFSRNKMFDIAKFLYASVDLKGQQSIRQQLRQDYARSYTNIMQSVVN